ncbi:hypothetical protein CJU90_3748 [Yarrowia sp. C11]|nr:hypothetical protein CKK34_5358 [Yarrowia sp. E02]KAG5367452.1 hypothetical protein CJU90_3748 [Yarrowia sp. C11]
MIVEAKKEMEKALELVETAEEAAKSRRSPDTAEKFDLPAYPDFFDGQDVTPLTPISTDIDNLGSCPCCSEKLTVSLVHKNTGLITCNNLDCIYPFNKESILSHFIHVPTNRILRETVDRMKTLENLSLKTIGIIYRDS